MGHVIDLLGSGESARDVDPLGLEGFVIGLNEAGIHKPCDFWFSLDAPYAASRMRDLGRIYGHGNRVHVCGSHRHLDAMGAFSIVGWRRVHTAQPCMAPGRLSSGAELDLGCTGFAALNLAAQLGAKEIRLWGYDFHNDYRYFYADEPHPRKHIERVRNLFCEVAPWYRAQGILVRNMNPDSSIKAFPYA